MRMSAHPIGSCTVEFDAAIDRHDGNLAERRQAADGGCRQGLF